MNESNDAARDMASVIHVEEAVAVVAHELNNIFTSIALSTGLLTKGDGPTATKRWAEIASQQIDEASKIISDLSLMARHPPRLQMTDINQVLRCVIAQKSDLLRQANIEVIDRLDPGLTKTTGDDERIREVFSNLVNNSIEAINTTHVKGALTIETRATEDNIEIVIRDDGPGIPQEDISSIFEPFFTTRNDRPGAGLGLSICMAIMRDHMGSINVESHSSQGAAFTLRLPIKNC